MELPGGVQWQAKGWPQSTDRRCWLSAGLGSLEYAYDCSGVCREDVHVARRYGDQGRWPGGGSGCVSWWL